MQQTPPATQARPPVATKQDISQVVAEAVVAQLFEALAYAKMQLALRAYRKKFVLNPESQDSAPDSIITYAAPPSSFVYLKSSNAAAPGAVLLRCQLVAAPARLTKNIHLGMSRAALGRLLGQPFSATVLLISETEGYQKFYFTFQKDSLQAVAFESDYLD
ncbi:MAG: hypothetical protein ACRYFK_13350 [Janthinobacterium lividum]